jgi:hypothetical protein
MTQYHGPEEESLGLDRSIGLAAITLFMELEPYILLGISN